MLTIAGAILSGGQNRRFNGRNKAYVDLDGMAIIQRSVDIFKSIFDEIILVTNRPFEYVSLAGSCRIITDIIEDGKNGLLVLPASSEGVSRALKKILNDKEFARKIAQQGYLTVQKKFTWQVVLDQMDKVYEALME